jgi:hypothetical protein
MPDLVDAATLLESLSGARLLIFSDRVFEIFCEGRVTWDLATLAGRQGTLMDELLEHVHELRGSPVLEVDFSIIEVRFQ